MTTENEGMPDIEMEASVDTLGAVAYAKGLGESLAAFYNAMIDHGLPENLATYAFEMKCGTVFEATAEAYEPDDVDEGEGEFP